MKLTKEQIELALSKAHKKSEANSYSEDVCFAHGFRAGVKFAQKQLTVEHKELCECKPKHIKHVIESNIYPSRLSAEYDECQKCGKRYNVKLISQQNINEDTYTNMA